MEEVREEERRRSEREEVGKEGRKERKEKKGSDERGIERTGKNYPDSFSSSLSSFLSMPKT